MKAAFSIYEDRVVNTYTLVAGKSKLRRADSTMREGFRVQSAPADGQTRIAATCTNMTLTQFAAGLHTIAPNYLRYPVVNAAGIESPWDFAFSFSSIPPGVVAASGGQGGQRGGGGERAAPSGDPVAPGPSL